MQINCTISFAFLRSPLVIALGISALMMSPVLWSLPTSSRAAVKDQARIAPDMSVAYAVHPWVSGSIPSIGRVPEALPQGDIIPKIVKTITIRKEKQKRSAIEGSIQLASLTPITSEPEFETKSVVIKTPFGVNIKTVVSLSGIPDELTSFLRKVQAECGQVTVISAFRRTGVPGTCHARHQAIDYQISDYACALKVAKTFRGGHSTDYLGVQAISRGMPRHYHVSICPREMGARFVHRGSSDARRVMIAKNRKVKRTRYAKRGKRVVQRAHVEKPYWSRES